jgi:succinate dehydrogenase/fumarate reductase iron-sulfur protein
VQGDRRDIAPRVTVEPIRGLPVLKDLIVDMEPFFAGYRSVLPYLINDQGEPDTERKQSPEDRHRFDDTTKCILCAACTTSCPIFWGDEEYVGPAAIVNAHRFIYDSRDEGREGAPEDPLGEDGRVPLPDDVQLHRRVPARHRGHEGDPGREALDPVRPVLSATPRARTPR